MQLWKEAELGKIRLRSRVVCTATGEGMSDANGHTTEFLVERYRKIVSGSAVGMVITGHAYITQSGKMRSGQIGIDSDDKIPGSSLSDVELKNS